MSRVNRVLQELNSLSLPSIFTYDEQELIRRVFKSVYGQLKSTEDKTIAKNILQKTEWIIGI